MQTSVIRVIRLLKKHKNILTILKKLLELNKKIMVDLMLLNSE